MFYQQSLAFSPPSVPPGPPTWGCGHSGSPGNAGWLGFEGGRCPQVRAAGTNPSVPLKTLHPTGGFQQTGGGGLISVVLVKVCGVIYRWVAFGEKAVLGFSFKIGRLVWTLVTAGGAGTAANAGVTGSFPGP